LDVRLEHFHEVDLLIKSALDEHEWMLATPEDPWKSMYCDELPSMEFKLPANSHLNWFGDYPIIEPEFNADWLRNR